MEGERVQPRTTGFVVHRNYLLFVLSQNACSYLSNYFGLCMVQRGQCCQRTLGVNCESILVCARFSGNRTEG